MTRTLIREVLLLTSFTLLNADGFAAEPRRVTGTITENGIPVAARL